jgi:hypothetical protein
MSHERLRARLTLALKREHRTADAIRAHSARVATSTLLRRDLHATAPEAIAAVGQSGVRALRLPATLLAPNAA